MTDPAGPASADQQQAAMVRGLSVREVATLAGVSVRYVHKAIAAGAVRAKRVGAHYRIPRSVALDFAVDCGAEPAPEAAAQARTTRTART